MRRFPIALVLLLPGLLTAQSAPADRFDLLIVGGRILDGSVRRRPMRSTARSAPTA